MSGERGMTLLELVVGLTIIGLALSGGYGALSAFTDQAERARGISDEAAVGAAKRRMVVRLLEGARLAVETAGPTFRGLDGVSGRVPDDELTFLTSTPTDVSAARSVARLYVDRDSLTPEHGLTLELRRPEGRLPQRIELAREAEGLDCRYFTRMLGHGEWLPSWVSGTVLPLGVELTVIPAVGDTLTPFLALPITVALEPAR
jgi:prepilin-type N-terminal cleavage/methylation domain-containing protein